MQLLAQSFTCFLIPCHKNFAVMSLQVVRILGCERPWIKSKIGRLHFYGITERCVPVDTSHKTVLSELLKATFSNFRSVFDEMRVFNSESVDWSNVKAW